MLSRHDLIEEGIETALTVGTALGTGIVHGRKGVMPSLGPIPLDAALGAGTLVLGMSGVLGTKPSKYVLDVSRGFLAYFGGSVGAQVGQRMRKSAGALTGTAKGSIDSGFLTGSRTITQGRPAPAALPAQPAANVQYTPAELVRRFAGKRAA